MSTTDVAEGDSGSGGFTKLGEKTVAQGTVIEMVVATFSSPSGEQFEREIVHHPGAVVVVAITDDDEVVLVRQYRAAIGAELLELPAGKRDVHGEATDVTAARELAEEVGRSAKRWDLLGTFYNSPGFSDELSWCYLARDLSEVADDLQGIEEHHMTVEIRPLDEVDRMIAQGKIVDAKTIVGVALALRHLGR